MAKEVFSWKDLHDWFRSIAAPSGTDERNELTSLQNTYKGKNSSYSDGTLTILTALNNPNVRINFYNMFPVSLSDLQLDTKMSADDIITADAIFQYDQFKIVPA